MSEQLTNEQKYRTPEERVKAFNAWCDSHYDGSQEPCAKCPLFRRDRKDAGECEFLWLALEAKAEKPEPCPFCGHEVYKSDVGINMLLFCSSCGYRSPTDKYSVGGCITAHNSVARAVRAAESKKGE